MNIVAKKALAILLFFITVKLQAQTGKITGTVKTSDGQPAEFVSVGLKGMNKGTSANNKGEYTIVNVEPGTYTLKASFIGLETIEQQVEVKANETTLVPEIILKESAQTLKEVVVSANKYNKSNPSSSLRLNAPLLEVAQNIQVVTGDALKDQQVISMSDGLIRNVSGVVRTEHWGDLYTNISTRGSQIQAFRNGFNVVNSYWGPLTEDMSFVESIEFIKGPAGFMLSSGDPSGLYNVVTKKPTGHTRGEASLTFGSFNLYRTTVDFDGKLSKDGKLLYRLNLAAQNKQTHRPNEYNDRYVFAPVISYQVDENTKLTFEYTFQRANMSNVGSYYVFAPEGYETLPLEFTALPAGTPGTIINDQSFFANLQHNLNSNWKLTAQAGYFLYVQEGYSMWPSHIDSTGKMIRNIGLWDAKSKMTMGQVFLNGNVRTGLINHRILGGLDMSRKNYLADWNQSWDLDTLGAEFDPKNPYMGTPVTGFPVFDRSKPIEERAYLYGSYQDQNYVSFYAQDELGFFENKLRLTLAGRYTVLSQAYYGADSASHFTPRAGLSVSLNKTFSFYALYDQAFLPQSGKLSSGQKVQPMTGNNLEAGFKKEWFGGKWITTLSVFHILKNNELTADPNSPPASGLSIELGQKTSQGVEFDLRGNIAKGLTLIANYAYNDSKVTKVSDGITFVEVGDVVPGFSKHTANAWLNYKITNGKLKGIGVSAGCTWLGDRATYWDKAPDPGKEMNDYMKVDGGLFWENDRIRIAANVFNLTNEYLYSGSYAPWFAAPVYSWQTEAPRNFRFSVNYRF
ncbi:MAG TPA: TonB-dependent receptor [Flavobacteriales bacterium]|nr:TonB-dependent receptor [Flavobacteriales bacterium]